MVAETTKQWSVSAGLQEDDKIAVEIRYGADWARAPFETSPENPEIAIQDVFLEIRDPLGNATEFDITYALTQGGTLAFWNISVTQHNGLNTTGLYNEKFKIYEGIGGIVQYDGNYSVTVTDLWPSKRDPPAYLGIFKGKIETVTEYPYASWLPWGAATGAVGTVASIIGLKLPKRKVPMKKKPYLHPSHSKSTRQR